MAGSDLGLVSRIVFKGIVNWVPLPRLGPTVDRDGVTAYVDSHIINKDCKLL